MGFLLHKCAFIHQTIKQLKGRKRGACCCACVSTFYLQPLNIHDCHLLHVNRSKGEYRDIVLECTYKQTKPKVRNCVAEGALMAASDICLSAWKGCLLAYFSQGYDPLAPRHYVIKKKVSVSCFSWKLFMNLCANANKLLKTWRRLRIFALQIQCMSTPACRHLTFHSTFVLKSKEGVSASYTAVYFGTRNMLFQSLNKWIFN